MNKQEYKQPSFSYWMAQGKYTWGLKRPISGMFSSTLSKVIGAGHAAVTRVLFHEQGNTNKTSSWSKPRSLMHVSPEAMKAILSSRMGQNKSGSERNVIGIQITTQRCTAKITN